MKVVDEALAAEFRKRLQNVNLSDLARLSKVSLRSLREYRNHPTRRACMLTIAQVGPWMAEAMRKGETLPCGRPTRDKGSDENAG